jgi:hypothetical protein
MTDSHKLRRNDHPVTSHEAAETVDTEQFEALALQIHLEYGLHGCTLDDLRHGFSLRAPPNTQFANRRTGLHQKGLVLDTGTKRRGEVGRRQSVYVATSLLTPEWIHWIKNNPDAKNDCLNKETPC